MSLSDVGTPLRGLRDSVILRMSNNARQYGHCHCAGTRHESRGVAPAVVDTHVETFIESAHAVRCLIHKILLLAHIPLIKDLLQKLRPSASSEEV